MLVKEMHIALDLGQQNMASERKIVVKPQEKDFFLNTAMDLFIKRKIDRKDSPKNKGFEDDQIAYDGLEELKRSAFLSTYENPYEAYLKYSILPKDYLHLINSSTYVYRDCVNLVKTSQEHTEHYWTLNFPNATGNSPFYSNFKIVKTLNAVDTDIYVANNNGENLVPILRNTESKFAIVNSVLENVNQLDNIEVYWEVYDNIYKRDSFIIVSELDPTATFRIEYGTIQPSNVNSDSITRDTVVINPINTDNYVGYMPNRLLSSDNIIITKHHSFMKTNYQSPLSYLERGRINVYHERVWEPTQVRLEYIKVPRRINIFANQSCELNANFHQDVVDIAIELIKARTEDPAYNVIAQENIRKE